MDTPHPTTLILDLRDRMARIETKIDGHYESHVVIDKRLDALEADVKSMDGRIDANTQEISTGKAKFATLAAVASAIIAVLSLLGDHLWSFLSGH